MKAKGRNPRSTIEKSKEKWPWIRFSGAFSQERAIGLLGPES
jgi:hypothetical protein